jgi:hypothetical protein
MKSVRERDPKGTARTDYSVPCPGCRTRILAGEDVTRVTLAGKRPEWWHAACRRKTIDELLGDA